tara:strand:+ start:3918 stop:4724 length:807 start_codon:yes stop_codon:yes gene_type:complete
MTTQDLYTKVVTGEITEQKFLYEVRRDTNLPFITPSNNFKDTITILKNKGMISEKQTKLSTGKQEVDIIAKTIDMVNPYEYARGMDVELGLENEAVGNVDITEDDIKKAQKKVLKNLTKDANYYSKKNFATMGDSEYEVEVNAKSIAALEKQKGKIIREGDDDGFASEDERENYYLDLDDVNEHGEEYDRVADVNASSTMLETDDIEELGRLRDSIYEKYAKKYGVDVDELKDKAEARRLEAIEVEDEDTAIAVQKKSPDSDVRIVKK